MALNFPAEPAVGDIYRDQGVAFQWTGTVWIALGASPNLGVPTGTVAYFAGKTPPDGWLLCNNQPVTSLYPHLRDYLLAAGSPFGMAGEDPRVPELRGEFIRGFVGNRAGVDDGRVFGSSQLDQLQRLVGQLLQVQTIGTGLLTSGILRQLASTASAIWQGSTSVPRNTTLQLDTAFDPTIRSGDETRPRNVALLPCIKAFDAVDITGMADLSKLLTAVATEAQVRAGVSNETLMTPANVRALNGRMTSGSLLDKTTYTFTGIPAEATEIEVFPRFIGPNTASQSVLFRPNGLDTGYLSGQQRIVHTAAAQWVVETTVGIAVTMETAADNVSGYLRLIRSQDALWAIDGKMRLSSGRLVQLSGTVLVEDITSLVLVSGGTGFKQAAGCDLRWRI